LLFGAGVFFASSLRLRGKSRPIKERFGLDGETQRRQGDGESGRGVDTKKEALGAGAMAICRLTIRREDVE
jgi:hypothetical protein